MVLGRQRFHLPDFPRRRTRVARGQSLVEFAIILPVLMLILGGIIQFGVLFWAQNTLTQIARDTGRWAATQTVSPCSAGAAAIQSQATAIAGNSSLLAPGNPVTATATWTPSGGTCPPVDNQTAYFVKITLTHDVPSFLPFLNYALPFCNGSTCTLSTSAQFRMEPKPAP
jgi:Flp pilus assembly protein TadG